MEAFTRAWLDAEGFRGFVPFSRLLDYPLPEDPGIYVVIREDASPAIFLDKSTAGPHKGKDPTVDRDKLEGRWIEGTVVVNIGKATNLRQRLKAYARQGAGFRAGHFGGRYVWQLEGSQKFLVAWKTTSGNPRAEESRLLSVFIAHYGKLPFANIVR